MQTRPPCADPATVWLVCPDDLVIMAKCAEHAAWCLDEYALHPDVPELTGWYSVPIEVLP